MPPVQGFDLYLLCIVALIEIARRVQSDRLQRLIVSTLAVSAFHLSQHKRQHIITNLQCALPESMAPAQIEQITRNVFHAFWQEVLDWSREDSRALAAHAQIIGAEHLWTALAQNRGAILWESGSFGKRVISKHILKANGFAVTQIHARLHAGGLGAGGRGMSRLLERVILPYFDRRTRSIVHDTIYLDQDRGLGFTRNLAQRLAQNAILCVAVDGRAGQKHLTLPFLGKRVRFATGIASLARLADAPLLPLYCTPAPNGGWLLEIGPPLPFSPDLTRDALTASLLTRVVGELDARIRRNPDWYWGWNLLQGE